MHLDHKKLTELLVETTGLAESTVEKNLTELVNEIQQAIADGDAYEVEGFGIFSGIGNNIIFIPSEELSTEINYKYVGMEAIEMDAPATSTSDDIQEEEESAEDIFGDDPLAEIMGGAAETEEETETGPEAESEPDNEFESDTSEDYDDPFAEIFNEAENDDDTEISEPDESEVESELQEAESETSLDEEEEIILDEIISSEEKEESEQEEEKPGPDKWGIDSYRDDADENRFSGLLGASSYEEEVKDEANEEEDIFGGDDADENKLSIMLDEDAAEAENQDESGESEEDFDDPFSGFETESETEGVASGEVTESVDSSKENEEIIPVIKNVSSGSGEKENVENTGIRTRTRSSREKQNFPVLLWILLGIILLGGATYGLGYFGIIDIPGIKGKNANSQTQTAATTTLPETNAGNTTSAESQQSTPPQNQTQQEETNAETQEDENTAPAAENNTQDTAPEQETEEAVTENMDPEQPLYGMMGTPMAAANNGYTIVIYSLSNQESAENEIQKLLNDGYRAMVFPIPHAQYGTLYRVSLGQFESLRDAALASEDLIEPYSQSYFITKIQPTN